MAQSDLIGKEETKGGKLLLNKEKGRVYLTRPTSRKVYGTFVTIVHDKSHPENVGENEFLLVSEISVCEQLRGVVELSN